MLEPAVSLSPCRPIKEHARQVMAWRNDPVTLAMSFHHEAKRWETFWPEFRDTYFGVEGLLTPVFALLGARRIGFLRHRPVAHPLAADRRTVDISINIAPEWRGRGVGTAALRAALDRLEKWDGDSVYAEVREENIPSRKAFLATGFRELDVAKKRVADTGEVCRIVRYLFEISPLFEEDGRQAGIAVRHGDIGER